MPRQPKGLPTPLYMLDAFSAKAKHTSFYIEAFRTHLQNHKFVSKAHKHDFYLLLYITKGSGTHTIDFVSYPISPGSFFVMTPGQVHFWNLNPGIDGFIIFFLPEFYQIQSMQKNLVDFPFFHSLSASPLIQLTGDDNHVVDFIAQRMHYEFLNTEKPDLRILRSYLEIILLKLSRNYAAHENADTKMSPEAQKIRQLEWLVEKNFIRKKQPRDYADLMNLSPSYLNSMVKKQIGKTLTDLISQRLILEARRLFSYSDLNVNEVADKLDFSDSSYFSRFFRKHTGLTPEQFKESLSRD